MRIILATDHAGFELKEVVKEYLLDQEIEVVDAGATDYDPDDDYPLYVAPAALEVSLDPEGTRAILFGGSGQGEAMVANRFENVRAAVYYGDPQETSPKTFATFLGAGNGYDPLEIVRLSRQHNDSNVLSLGARFLQTENALSAVVEWLQTPYSGEQRHERRIQEISTLFTTGVDDDEEIEESEHVT